MAQISSTKCNICEKEIGKLFCYECQHFLCNSCKLFHEKCPATKRHSVTESHNIDRATLSLQLLCDKHELDFVHYCLTCESLTCSACVTSIHKGHSFTEIAEITVNARKVITENVVTLKAKMKNLSDLIDRIKSKEIGFITNESDTFICKVNKISDEVIGIVNSVKEIQIIRASDYFVTEKQQLEYSRAKLEKTYTEYQTICGKLEQLLVQKNDVAFFVIQKPLIKEFEELDDIPQIDEPLSIEKFKEEDFIDLTIEKLQSKFQILDFKAEFQQLKDNLGREQKKYIALQKTNEAELVGARQDVERLKREVNKKTGCLKLKVKENQQLRDIIGQKRKEISMLQRRKEAELLKVRQEINKLKTEAKRNAEFVKSKEENILQLELDKEKLKESLESKDKLIQELEPYRRLSKQTKLVSVAISIGSTYSGLSILFRHSSPSEVFQYKISRLCEREPTSVLLNDRKEFVCFGRNAELRYGNLKDDEIHDWYLFKGFMRKLNLSKEADGLIMVKTFDDQKQLPAIDIFSMVVKHLMSLILDHIVSSCMWFRINEIQWVLTVPNFSSGVQVMLKVAKEAMTDHDVMIVTEADAAFWYSWQIQQEFYNEFIYSQRSFTLIVLSCEDVLLEITAHTVFQNYTIHQRYEKHVEINYFDEVFKKLMSDIFSRELFIKYCEIEPEDAEYLKSKFQNSIVLNFDESKDEYNIKVPHKLATEAELQEKLNIKEGMKLVGLCLKINKCYILKLINESLGEIYQQLQLFIANHNLSTFYGIIMVGNVCNNAVFQRMIREAYPDKIIVVPRNPQLAVLIGAAIYGRKHFYE